MSSLCNEDDMLNHIKVRDGDHVPNALDMFPCQISKENRTKLQKMLCTLTRLVHGVVGM